MNFLYSANSPPPLAAASTGYLSNLPDDSLRSIASYLTITEAATFFACSKRLYQLAADPHYWEYKLAASLSKSFSNRDTNVEIRSDNPRDVLQSLVTGLPKEIHELVDKVLESSSTDRQEESHDNILVSSLCQKLFEDNKDNPKFRNNLEALGRSIQYRNCMCGQSRPCYWSSKPSSTENIYESITFLLTSPVSVIYGFSLSPYQAFWHPDAPIYAPKECCIELLLPVLNEKDIDQYSGNITKVNDVSYYIY